MEGTLKRSSIPQNKMEYYQEIIDDCASRLKSMQLYLEEYAEKNPDSMIWSEILHLVYTMQDYVNNFDGIRTLYYDPKDFVEKITWLCNEYEWHIETRHKFSQEEKEFAHVNLYRRTFHTIMNIRRLYEGFDKIVIEEMSEEDNKTEKALAGLFVLGLKKT